MLLHGKELYYIRYLIKVQSQSQADYWIWHNLQLCHFRFISKPDKLNCYCYQVEQLEQELTELRQALADKQEQERAMLEVCQTPFLPVYWSMILLSCFLYFWFYKLMVFYLWRYWCGLNKNRRSQKMLASLLSKRLLISVKLSMPSRFFLIYGVYAFWSKYYYLYLISRWK